MDRLEMPASSNVVKRGDGMSSSLCEEGRDGLAGDGDGEVRGLWHEGFTEMRHGPQDGGGGGGDPRQKKRKPSEEAAAGSVIWQTAPRAP